MKTRFLFWSILSLFLAACSAPRSLPLSQNIEFTVLQLNDIYEIAPLEGGKTAGLARVATVKRELLRENPNTIAVIAGDFLSPSFLGNLKLEDGERIAGLQMVETFNVMGLDYATFGNHEFDLKDADLLKKRMDQSSFRYVCCNALHRTDAGLAPFTQRIGNRDEAVPPYLIREFRNANGDMVRVAIVGVVLPFNKASYVDYRPVTEAFAEACREAQTKADIVVALTHLTVEQDRELAAAVPGVTLFMGGHDHTNMNHYVENTIITKADANAKTVYIHRFTYSPVSRMTRVRSSLRHINDGIAEEPSTKAVVDRWQERAFSIMKNQGYHPERLLMTTTEPLICTEYMVRSTPTNFGALTTQAMEAAWPGADVYLLNSGSMRLDDNLDGAVTEYDVLRTFPYGGPITRMELTGAVLDRVLRTGLITNRTEGGYMQVRYAACEDGACRVKGNAIDPQRKYSVVLPQFVAKGLEQNLDFLAGQPFEEPETFQIDGKALRNDIRDMVIAFMQRQ